MKKVYAFDLDETLCTRDKSMDHIGHEKYKFCTPIVDMIEKLNKLYNEGNIIYIYTARGMETFNGDINKVYNNLYNLTLDSLKKWGVNHHGLIMGKLNYDYLIDDKAINSNDFKI